MTTSTRESLHRGSVLVTLQISMWAFFLFSFGPSIPLLRDELGISSGLAAVHQILSSVGAIVAGAFTPLIRRWGRARTRWFGTALLAFGTLVFILGPNMWFTLLGALITGTGGSAIVNTSNVSLMAHHGPEHGPRWTNSAHGFAVSVGVLAPLVMGASVALGLGWRAGFALVPVIALVLVISMRHHLLDGDQVGDPEATIDHPHARGPLPAKFKWMFVALMLLTVMEFSTTLWTTDIVRVRHGMSDSQAAFAVSGFLVGMAAMRWASGPLLRRFTVERIAMTGILVAVVGQVLLLMTTTPVQAFISLLILGAGAGPQYPLWMSKSLEVAGAAADRAASLLSVGLGVTVALGPFALGVLSDGIGVRAAYAVIPFVTVLAFALMAMARKVPS